MTNKWKENPRKVHMATRFDRELIQRFDQIAAEQRMSRTKALECLISNAVKDNNIPPFAREIFDELPKAKRTLRGPGEHVTSRSKTLSDKLS